MVSTEAGWGESGMLLSTKVLLLQKQAGFWGILRQKWYPGGCWLLPSRDAPGTDAPASAASSRRPTELLMHPTFTYCHLINIFASDLC